MAAAFAQPVREPGRAVITRVVLVDHSRAVAEERALRDSALGVVREGDLLIAFDTMVRVYTAGVRDSIAILTPTRAQASLSAALVAAHRAAAVVRDRADSVELVIVSSFATASWDEATWTLRARWTGRVRLIPVPLARGDTMMPGIDVRAPVSDPVRAAAAPFASSAVSRTRILRRAPAAADSAWASARHVLVHWPYAADSVSSSAVAVVAPGVVLAAPLVRRAFDNADGARTVARFADGAPAIVEHPHGGGCIRDVGFDFPVVGDVPLRESTRRLLRVVGAPCENDEARSAMTVARLDSLHGTGPLLAAAALPRPPHKGSVATSWLLIVGALLLLAEVGVRQRTVRA
jgi:hypothetical protein